MELDSFLASPRWEILKIIIRNPSSPIELAEELKTTPSFISQQLKLLEAAGLVKKKRTGAVEKGKPRSVFSIANESLYLIPLVKGIPEKKFVHLSSEQKAILKIWYFEQRKNQILLEKFFWRIHDFLDVIDSILVVNNEGKIKAYIVSKETSLTQKINAVQKSRRDTVTFQVVASATSLAKLDPKNVTVLYGPQDILGAKEGLKGGIE